MRPWPLPDDQPALGSAQAHVWRASLDQPAVAMENLYKVLSPDERAKVGRFHFGKDRRHFIVARACLRKLLGQYLAIEPAELRFAYGAYGKPHLDPTMLDPPAKLKFNLAHAGGLAVFAFTRLGEIGVDLELIKPITADDIVRRFFSAAEVASFDQLPADDRALAFFNCWTRKEAFIKAKGMCLSLPLDQFDVTLAPDQEVSLLRTRWDENEAARWSLRTLEIGDSYVGAVALESHDWQLVCCDFAKLLLK
ncbi:MAG: 4'-phosphopantetheinyl transferase family protein [Pyrinomonadaceae bacterium]